MEGKRSREERERAEPPPPPSPRPSGRPLPPPPPRGGPPSRVQPIDREKTCPLLLRVFTKIGSHHTHEDFAVRGKEPKNEVQIYTWKDATLRELTDLVKEVSPSARRRDAKLSFATVYPDRNGRMQVKKVSSKLSFLTWVKPSPIQISEKMTAWRWVTHSFRQEITWMYQFSRADMVLARCNL